MCLDWLFNITVHTAKGAIGSQGVSIMQSISSYAITLTLVSSLLYITATPSYKIELVHIISNIVIKEECLAQEHAYTRSIYISCMSPVDNDLC